MLNGSQKQKRKKEKQVKSEGNALTLICKWHDLDFLYLLRELSSLLWGIPEETEALFIRLEPTS